MSEIAPGGDFHEMVENETDLLIPLDFNVPACLSLGVSSLEGYVVTEISLHRHDLQVQVQCAPYYKVQGQAHAVPCKSPETPYSLEGCVAEVCVYSVSGLLISCLCISRPNVRGNEFCC